MRKAQSLSLNLEILQGHTRPMSQKRSRSSGSSGSLDKTYGSISPEILQGLTQTMNVSHKRPPSLGPSLRPKKGRKPASLLKEKKQPRVNRHKSARVDLKLLWAPVKVQEVTTKTMRERALKAKKLRDAISQKNQSLSFDEQRPATSNQLKTLAKVYKLQRTKTQSITHTRTPDYLKQTIKTKTRRSPSMR